MIADMTSKHRLLVVDDERNFLQMIADYFKNHGFDVATADNLEAAITAFQRQRPKVVILDFNMPIVSGEKFLPILQSVDPAIRVIVVTGCIRPEVEEKFKGLGYYALFEKGNLSLEDLRRKVEEAIRHG